MRKMKKIFLSYCRYKKTATFATGNRERQQLRNEILVR